MGRAEKYQNFGSSIDRFNGLIAKGKHELNLGPGQY
jgi:uncharacterized protein YaaN involved in tellurite resistance